MDEGSMVGTGLHQENRTPPPTADNSVQHSMGVAQKEAAFPNRKLVHHGGDAAVFAGTTGVTVNRMPVIQNHFVAGNLPGKARAGPRFDRRQVLRPGPGGLERAPVGILVDYFRLHRLIAADGARSTYPDLTPGRKWFVPN